MRFDNKGRGGPGRGRGRGRGAHRHQQSHEQECSTDHVSNSSDTAHDVSNTPPKVPVDDNRFDSLAARTFLDARWETASNNPGTIKHKQQQSAWGNGRVPFRKTDFAAEVLEKARSSA